MNIIFKVSVEKSRHGDELLLDTILNDENFQKLRGMLFEAKRFRVHVNDRDLPLGTEAWGDIEEG